MKTLGIPLKKHFAKLVGRIISEGTLILLKIWISETLCHETIISTEILIGILKTNFCSQNICQILRFFH